MQAETYIELDGVAIAAALRDREVSAVEVAEAALDRIAATVGELGAFTVTLAESARAGAAEIDSALAWGEAVGELTACRCRSKTRCGCATPRRRPSASQTAKAMTVAGAAGRSCLQRRRHRPG